MKKMLLIAIMAFACFIQASADVIPPNSHLVTKTVVFSNCSQFPDIQLAGYITGPTIPTYQIDQIKENVALAKGYKFNIYKVYALKTSFVQAKGGIAGIDFAPIVLKVAPVDIPDPGSYYIENTKPLASEALVYRIYGYNAANQLVVYLSQRTLTYTDGTQPQVTNYTYP
jgi:hypothetical protein